MKPLLIIPSLFRFPVNKVAVRILRLAVIFVCFSHQVSGQGYREAAPFPYPYEINDPGIKTLQLGRIGWEMGYPIMNLSNPNERILISFDDLTNHVRDLKYRLIHCSANWEPSDISTFDYLNGQPEDFLVDYAFSRNSGQQYVHYSLYIPNERMQPKITGNYKLQVFSSEAPDSVLLECGFMVYRRKIKFGLNPLRATDVDYRYTGQEIDFSIYPDHYNITNPYEDMKVFILQNFRSDNAIQLDPLFIKGDELEFDYQKENVFHGGNEFRRLDLRRLTPTENVHHVEQGTDMPEVYMRIDEKRAFKTYKNEFDINGRFVSKINDFMFSNDLDAEYVKVHFELDYPYYLPDKDIYIVGELSGRKPSERFKMYYNPSTKHYQRTVTMKQGYYNYLYQVVEKGKFPTALTDALWDVEGTHYETENEYLILVYHKNPSNYYDSLIGFAFVQFPPTD